VVMPRKDTATHFLHGTQPHAPKATPTFQGGRPKLPAHLGKAARSEMKRCIALLEARGTLTPGDISILAVYAEVFSRWVVAKQALGNQLMVKTTIIDPHGKQVIVERVNPLLKIARECEQQIVQLAAKLGLTPVDRARSRQTDISERKDGIVPGSIADLYPELLTERKDVIPFVPLAPEAEETEDAE
jgi:P27 family predicted phage terminase small subunit